MKKKTSAKQKAVQARFKAATARAQNRGDYKAGRITYREAVALELGGKAKKGKARKVGNDLGTKPKKKAKKKPAAKKAKKKPAAKKRATTKKKAKKKPAKKRTGSYAGLPRIP